MPLDAMFLTALKKELDFCIGMRIDKVQQPERDLIILNIRGSGSSARLLISAAVGRARVHVTHESFENPMKPPMFCMLLRKHLVGARIADISQPNTERLLSFKLTGYDEMGVFKEKHLIIEMIGSSPNIILTDADGITIDCLRRIGMDRNERRQVLPGLLYHLPKSQDKIPFLDINLDMVTTAWSNASYELPADKWLIDTFAGLSPLVCREVCSKAFGQVSPRIGELSRQQIEMFPHHIIELSEYIKGYNMVPYMILEGALPKDFSFMPIYQYGEKFTGCKCESFSGLLDGFYGKKDKLENIKRRSQEFLKTVKTMRDRQQRKLLLQQQELKKTENRDTLRKYGDLITANLYSMKKGISVIRLQDYYSENFCEIDIPLNPLKTPQQNAAAYYKEYSKAKNAEKYLTGLIQEGKARLEYLESVLSGILQAETMTDLNEIKAELMETGLIRRNSGKQDRNKKSKNEKVKNTRPRRFKSSTGMEILVGRSNIQNDTLTLKTARRTDLWLHTQKVHGSHVIVSCNGLEPDDETIAQAASLAVYYSQARDGCKIPVDYTQVRNVKKPSGALPGMVIYTNYKTLLADANEELVKQLSVKD